MSIASVHYLSMNVRDGIVTPTGAFAEQVAQTITPSRLQPSKGYTIDWGDDSSDTTFTSNTSGTTTAKSHTYERGGTYTIEVSVTASGQVAAKKTVSVSYNNGTIAADGTVTEGVSETFTLASLPTDRELDITWGDGDDDTVTTSGSGGGTKAHTYDLPGSYDITVVDPVTSHEYAALTVSVLFDNGTIAADGTVTKDLSETFTLASLPKNRALVIDWGDETDDAFTTNNSGGGTKAHTYTAAGSYDITVIDPVLEHTYATLNLTVLAGD